MATTYRSELSALRAQAGEPIDLQRLQDHLLRSALERVHVVQEKHSNDLKAMMLLVAKRTQVLSPRKGFSTGSYYRSQFANVLNSKHI